MALPAPPPLTALADRCVQCGLCLPHCPTYALTGNEAESPRGRIALIRGLASSRLAPSPDADTALDHCLGCARCEAACPANVPYLDLLDRARNELPRATSPKWRRSAALAALASPRLLGAAMAVYRAIHPALPTRWRVLPRPPASPPARQPDRPDALLASGCIAAAYEAPVRAAARRLFAATGWAVNDAPEGCCGAAARHAGESAQAERLRTRMRKQHPPGLPLLTLASGCAPDERDALSGHAPVQDAIAALADRAEVLRLRPRSLTITVQTPCTRRMSGGDPVFDLLARVPGLRVVALPDRGCCGAAGLHQIQFPERANALRNPLVDAIRELGADRVLSANIGCRLHLAMAAGVPVQHPLEFLAECLP